MSGEKVGIELAEGSVTQVFDLTAAKREGTPPAIYYRADRYPLEANINIEKSLPGKEYENGGRLTNTDDATLTLGVEKVRMAYETENTKASGPDRALLVLQAQAELTNAYDHINPMPLDRVTLTLPDETVVHPMRSYPDDTQELWGGKLAFDVPATFTKGTLRVAPGRVGATYDGKYYYLITGSQDIPISVG